MKFTRMVGIFGRKINKAISQLITMEDQLDEAVAKLDKDIEKRTEAAINYVYANNKLVDRMESIKKNSDAMYAKCKQLKYNGTDPAIVKEHLKTYMSYKNMADDIQKSIDNNASVVEDIKRSVTQLRSYRDLCLAKRDMLAQRIELIKLTDSMQGVVISDYQLECDSVFREIEEVIRDKELKGMAEREVKQLINSGNATLQINSNSELDVELDEAFAAL